MTRQRLAYTTDLTDEAWQILEPLLPPEETGGRPRTYPRREVLNGLQYVLRGGCAWRAWRQDGTWVRIHDQRRDRGRPAMGRHPPAGCSTPVASLEVPSIERSMD
jgi:transposase